MHGEVKSLWEEETGPRSQSSRWTQFWALQVLSSSHGEAWDPCSQPLRRKPATMGGSTQALCGMLGLCNDSEQFLPLQGSCPQQATAKKTHYYNGVWRTKVSGHKLHNREEIINGIFTWKDLGLTLENPPGLIYQTLVHRNKENSFLYLQSEHFKFGGNVIGICSQTLSSQGNKPDVQLYS